MYEGMQNVALVQGAGPTGIGFIGLLGLILVTAMSPREPERPASGPSVRGNAMNIDRMTLIALPFAIGAIGFGLAGLIHGNFWVQWQLVPESLPGRVMLAQIGNALLIVGGALLLWRPPALWAAILLAGFYGFWAVAIHAPRLAAHPANVGVWLGFAEIVAFAIGGAVLALLLTERWRPMAMRAATILFGGCALVFGVAHFVYLDITASMVPAWMPARHFLAGLTGIAHLAAAASIASGVLARLAATLMTAMVASFALLVHVPRVIASPGDHMEWSMLCIAITLAGACWIMRAGLTAQMGSQPER